MGNERYENNYRFPPEFIARWTRICCWSVLGGVAIAMATGFAGVETGRADVSDNTFLGNTGGVLAVIALVAGIGGVAFGFVVAAWLGGESLQRGGGWIGLLLLIGLAGVIAGWDISPVWGYAGVGCLIASIVLCFWMGIRARVPIWLQLPILGSPRLYLRRGESERRTGRPIPPSARRKKRR